MLSTPTFVIFETILSAVSSSASRILSYLSHDIISFFNPIPGAVELKEDLIGVGISSKPREIAFLVSG